MYEYKANYNDLISDFNLYLCERYGYRNACSVMWNANGICISIHRGSLDIYIRFWEYSKGVGNYPDWSIIIARCEFRDELRENRFELLKDLVRFFKEYMPRYGYTLNLSVFLTVSFFKIVSISYAISATDALP